MRLSALEILRSRRIPSKKHRVEKEVRPVAKKGKTKSTKKGKSTKQGGKKR